MIVKSAFMNQETKEGERITLGFFQLSCKNNTILDTNKNKWLTVTERFIKWATIKKYFTTRRNFTVQCFMKKIFFQIVPDR